MAIQLVDLKVPNGDTPRSANIKINANFSDATHAASKLVGAEAGKVPLAENVLKAWGTLNSGTAPSDCNDFLAGTRYSSVSPTTLNAPPSGYGVQGWTITTSINQLNNANYVFQLATSFNNNAVLCRVKGTAPWTEWTPVGQTIATYSTTTAAGANTVVDSTGKLMRSTSSERYKDILAPLELDDARYADAMALKPIVYRSTADADNPAYHYYSFSAEELGAYDPAFTLWRETETVTDEDGNVTEQPLAERQAEGININALLAMGHAIAIKQGELIKDLQDQVIEQKEAIAALKQTNP